jgi:hypothetical protein
MTQQFTTECRFMKNANIYTKFSAQIFTAALVILAKVETNVYFVGIIWRVMSM